MYEPIRDTRHQCPFARAWDVEKGSLFMLTPNSASAVPPATVDGETIIGIPPWGEGLYGDPSLPLSDTQGSLGTHCRSYQRPRDFTTIPSQRFSY